MADETNSQAVARCVNYETCEFHLMKAMVGCENPGASPFFSCVKYNIPLSQVQASDSDNINGGLENRT